MPIEIGQKLESDFRNPLGLLSDCHRRIERFLNALIVIAEEARGNKLNEDVCIGPEKENLTRVSSPLELAWGRSSR